MDIDYGQTLPRHYWSVDVQEHNVNFVAAEVIAALLLF